MQIEIYYQASQANSLQSWLTLLKQQHLKYDCHLATPKLQKQLEAKGITVFPSLVINRNFKISGVDPYLLKTLLPKVIANSSLTV